ncbi:GHMP kinase [Flavivirga aquatica]|uniref:GHMP kinase n=1 Tax=Flavivirga aquatica TaxID=1849968 RepID=A0A1E5T7M1_9FLAO|nr:GYDIA family GHMP kinase [Flavivirga aquatica]OEK07373.1 GHMP kinase [Flavivirga aquatica]
MKNNTFYSNGKLLISGEYVVLDGANALAVPTKHGQSLIIEPIEHSNLIWESLDEKGAVWFESEFPIKEVSSSFTPSNDILDRLIQILHIAKQLNPLFLSKNSGCKITTALDFPKNWGLGTSSTLINNIAQWANIDPYKLLENTFGGSGYDIACAQHHTPITYRIENKTPITNKVRFNPLFKNHLYFIHLNKKQNSRDGIKHYHANKENSKSAIQDINRITSEMIICNTLDRFEKLINQHESIISKITRQTSAKHLLFKDFKGAIKSLGAWGGDFILATSKENPTQYFKDKGFTTVIPYKDMVL